MFEPWLRKFANAFHGVRLGVEGQNSFLVHLPLAASVLILAWLLRCSPWQWCVLVLCIALVLSLELLNSALEHLARGLCSEHNAQVGKALDIASAAVLLVSVAAAAVGLLIFVLQGWAWWNRSA
ncbi:MAG: diacylglycerol kinase [Planctomycetales bacterium]|nr:diacylglycerol kinase [Planctomycetales bacterium]